MKIPISWLKDFVNVDLPIEDLAHRLTMAGLEVEEIRYVGLPMPDQDGPEWSSGHARKQETKVTGIEWDPEKIVVGAILEVMPHPNADRLVLARLDDGEREHIVLTGAPNLFPYKGKGQLEQPLKVAYAREGARIYDGHQAGQVLMTLQRARIRGVESYSMACSEKELGISDEHEGVIILDEAAPTGKPLAEYMGDAVLDIAITPNIARDANVLGVAREIAALTGKELRQPSYRPAMEGPRIDGRAAIQIRDPALNPRFVLGLIEDIRISPSPYEVQRRLRLAGMRPINNIVDATNFAMYEIGQPLHAFDYDVLVERAGGEAPTVITRTAQQGERLITLDGVERILDDFTVLVCDTAGPLSIAGVMGGAESEVNENTRNVLLEGAAWNFINIRRTISSQRLSSEAAYRFSRGVHPAMAERGVLRGLDLMNNWADGTLASGVIDNYPLPPEDPIVEITPLDVERWLGISIPVSEIAEILRRLEFDVEVQADRIRAKTPDHRLDIGAGVIGLADLLEEIARIYGYDRIPETRLADELPPQRKNRSLELEERMRDILVKLGLQEVMTYRMTAPEREARLFSPGVLPDETSYVRIANPIASDRVVMRRSLLAALLEALERNARTQEREAIFEIGPVYIPLEDSLLPEEPLRLAIALAGPRAIPTWQEADTGPLNFFDLKGILGELFESLHLEALRFEPAEHPYYHPGRCANILLDEETVGHMGEIHPLVHASYEFTGPQVVAAEFDLEAITAQVPERYNIRPVPAFPPVLEDLAVVVDEDIPAAQVEGLIYQAGGDLVREVKLFDVYKGDQVEPGRKSLAYRITYQAVDRTLTDLEVLGIRQRIVRSLEGELGARLRGQPPLS